MIKVSFDKKKSYYIEKVRNKTYLGTNIVSADTHYVAGIIVPQDYEIKPNTNDSVIDTIIKVEGDKRNSYTYYVSELKNGDKTYVSTILFDDGEPKVSVDYEDRKTHRIVHKGLNSAEKIDKIAAFLRANDVDVDRTITFLRGVGYA